MKWFLWFFLFHDALLTPRYIWRYDVSAVLFAFSRKYLLIGFRFFFKRWGLRMVLNSRMQCRRTKKNIRFGFQGYRTFFPVVNSHKRPSEHASRNELVPWLMRGHSSTGHEWENMQTFDFFIRYVFQVHQLVTRRSIIKNYYRL